MARMVIIQKGDVPATINIGAKDVVKKLLIIAEPVIKSSHYKTADGDY
ncbi:MAG: hypothetical protein L6M37_04070 [Candidatus Methylarchaceae archaeon HK02M1]|nr:hypothetical protein [Candidatus Methylarchaceae archaeon HK01M]MCP8312113.1 hypothetical protein [Candidatus Methylarchaceae archaeon HK02M1]